MSGTSALTLIALWVASGCARPELAHPAAPLPAANGDWLARAQRQLAEREYQASANGEGLQAPNRAHNLRTYFEPTGIRVHDRTAAGSPELLRAVARGRRPRRGARGGRRRARSSRDESARRDPPARARRVVRELGGGPRAGLHAGASARRATARSCSSSRSPARSASLRGDARACSRRAARRTLALRRARGVATRRARARRRTSSCRRATALRIVVDDAGATYPARDRSAAHGDGGRAARVEPGERAARDAASPAPAT